MQCEITFAYMQFPHAASPQIFLAYATSFRNMKYLQYPMRPPTIEYVITKNNFKSNGIGVYRWPP